jgi:hypothetical protein
MTGELYPKITEEAGFEQELHHRTQRETSFVTVFY